MKLQLFWSAAAVGALLVFASDLAAQSSQRVTLAWRPGLDVDLAGYLVHYGTASGVYVSLTNVGINTNATIDGLQPGQTYYFAVTAQDTSGLESPPSNEVSYQVPPVPPPSPTGLPAPWQAAGIGIGTGSATESNGVFLVQGAGTISGLSDKFRFVYQPLTGDGQITVRLQSVDQTGADARAGVMVRGTLTANSKHAFIGMSPDGSFRWLYRTKVGGSTGSTLSSTGAPPNVWLRVSRTGNNVAGYKSIDGTNWTRVGSRSIAMATNIYFGLAVASGNTNTLNNSAFINVSAVP